MERLDVLAIGELVVDMISDEYVPTLSSAKSFQMLAGGSPANVCANLRWMGLQTTLISCVGNDGLGDFMLKEIEYSGLDDKFVSRSSAPTSMIMVGRSRGTPDFIAYRGADADIHAIEPSLIERARLVHTTAFALSKNPAQQHILHALASACRQDKIISIDWNFAPSLWGTDGQNVFDTVIKMNPLLKISLDDASRFAGKVLSIAEAKEILLPLNARATCLTCGKEGIWYKEKDQLSWQYQPAAYTQNVKDTTGAGDAFWSGFCQRF